MTDVEIIQLKLQNVLKSFIGRSATNTVKAEIEQACNNILAEHKDDLLSAHFELTSEWNKFTAWEKVIAYICREDEFAKGNLIANVQLEPKEKF